MKPIYLVEDEKSLNDLLSTYLKDAGYEVVTFYDGLKAKEAIGQEPAIWILDIMLPGLDGYGLIKAIKEKEPKTPVIFMSARSAELDRVIGLELGSDDYLPKPFLPRELVLRVKRIIGQSEPVSQTKSTITLGNYLFDPNKRTLSGDSNTHSLSVKEFDLLTLFSNNIDKALSRNDILDTVWGTDYFGSDRVIDDTLRRLRKKFPKLPIETVYGYGYMLKAVGL